jgi:hypothetical protein
VQVAERVMGLCFHSWKVQKERSYSNIKFACSKCKKEAWGGDATMPPDYPNDITAAFAVAAKIETNFTLDFDNTNDLNIRWYAAFEHGDADGESAPLAICRAALKAAERKME